MTVRLVSRIYIALEGEFAETELVSDRASFVRHDSDGSSRQRIQEGRVGPSAHLGIEVDTLE